MLQSFPSENLIVINEYINEKDKKLNILYYYTYDKNLKFEFKTKEEINFQHLLKEENIENIENYELVYCITNIKKFKNGKLYLFSLSTIYLEEKRNFDEMGYSFYEDDYNITLNIYLYENKQLTEIYKNNYIKSFYYYEDINESDYVEFINIWNDENLIIFEKDEKILFLDGNLNCIIIVNIATKKLKTIKYNLEYKCKFLIYNKKSNTYYLLLNIDNNIQTFQSFQLSQDKQVNKKTFAFPFYFSNFLITKNGYLLGMVKRIFKYYNYSPFFQKYIPQTISFPSLCLINISKI